MNKNIIFEQPAGQGDIFFLLKAAHYYIEQGYRIIWPILPQLLYIKDYIKVDGLEFVDSGSDWQREYKDIDFAIPFYKADNYFTGSWQHAKYKFIGLDHSDWAKYLKIERNYERETQLQKLINLPDDYIFVNRRYGTPPNCKIKDFKVDTKSLLPIVECQIIDGFNPFDWLGILEEATEHWQVDGSWFYLMETLNLKATKLMCFARDGHDMNISGLFKKNWKINL